VVEVVVAPWVEEVVVEDDNLLLFDLKNLYNKKAE
jgi:hypothetical protein